jgi:hypothetical protein
MIRIRNGQNLPANGVCSVENRDPTLFAQIIAETWLEYAKDEYVEFFTQEGNMLVDLIQRYI